MSWGSWLPRELPIEACGRVGRLAAFSVPRGVEEVVIFAAIGPSLEVRSDGSRGAWVCGGVSAKSSTCVVAESEETVDSTGLTGAAEGELIADAEG